MRELEACCYCGDPTGRAGKGEDSLYCDACGGGPYCEECWDNHLEDCCERKLAALEDDLRILDEAVGVGALAVAENVRLRAKLAALKEADGE